ncbi:MAG TPA: AraC family transcriptional regulator [Pseudomonas sp.]|jgi:AraC-like DNA-binding protein|nr:AraC family transcriptional regulator [Pseudomonas sp.]
MSYVSAAPFSALESSAVGGVVASRILADEPRAFAPHLREILHSLEVSLDSDPSAARALLARVAQMVEARPAPPATAQSGLAPWQARKVRTHIDQNLDTAVAIGDLARMAGLSLGYFSKAFKRTFGQTPHAYVVGRRVEAAKTLMLTTREPLSQVAYQCGFADQAHFCRIFRKVADATPASWRRAHRLAA